MTKLDLQFFGGEAETGENAETITEETTETVDTDSEQSEQVESVAMTQAEIDDIYNKAFAKGARKGKREALAEKPKNPTPEAQTETSDTGDLSKQADKKLSLANKRLVKGTVLSMDNSILTANGKKALLNFANFDDCFDEGGELNEEDVKDRMKEFAENYPEFSKKEESPNKVVIPPAGQVTSDPYAWNPKATEVAEGRQLNPRFKQY